MRKSNNNYYGGGYYQGGKNYQQGGYQNYGHAKPKQEIFVKKMYEYFFM
jgi:hypothetical protein